MKDIKSVLTPALVAKFWGKVWDVPTEGCWYWEGEFDNTARMPMVNIEGLGRVSARRVAWAIAGGELREKKPIKPMCGDLHSQSCVRPSHLTDMSKEMVKYKWQRQFENWFEQKAQEMGRKVGSELHKELLPAWKLVVKSHVPANGLPKTDAEVLVVAFGTANRPEGSYTPRGEIKKTQYE